MTILGIERHDRDAVRRPGPPLTLVGVDGDLLAIEAGVLLQLGLYRLLQKKEII